MHYDFREPCRSCGHCPLCGSRPTPYVPYRPWHQGVPQYPVYVHSTTSTPIGY